ncbi:hypothetical protein [Aquibacillus albus]|uniref:Uncharacterized protein n=1 Tax=Aquibacillus albus TaxID=1168171 RepID=A0ABS2N4G5_9BACI|nr:hypothetical protein [Aquibacillus albus]MBM7573013.1 hypothetical protein [Aquibacillus albus]
MKQYIFLLKCPVGSKEIKIETDGMLDALTQAKEYLKKTTMETSYKVDIQYKGTVYSNQV